MKIDAIDVYLIKNELYFPWVAAHGSEAYNVSLLVRITSGGVSGWSESSPFETPTFSPEHARGAFYVIENFLIPQVLNKEFEDAESFNKALNVIKGNPFAKAALEIAWWTLQAKLTKTPFYKLIGGSYKEITVGQALGVQPNLDMLIQKVGTLIDEGSPRVKLKMIHGWDYDMLAAVRSTFPTHTFHVDCNSSYTIEEIDLFKKIDRFELAMIEQPFYHQDIVDHAKLAKTIETPICLDESITSPIAARQAIELGACKLINIKPGRVGGILNSIEINKLCAEAGIGCWIGGMLENDVGRGILKELCSLPNMAYPSDVNPAFEKIKYTFVDNPLTYIEPYKFYPAETENDLIEPNEELLKEIVIESKHFGV